MPKSPIPLETLLANLHGPDWAARCEAARLLGQSRDPRAVDALLPDLADPDWRVRRNAAQALGALRDPRAMPALIPLLHDRTATVCQRAAVALGRIKDRQAIAPLIAEVTATRSKASTEAWQALRKFGKAAAPELLAAAQAQPHLALLQLLVALKHPQALPLLLPLLHGPQHPQIIQALAQLGDPRAIAPLLALLATGDRWTQGLVVQALGQLPAHDAVPQLLALLQDADLYGPRGGLYHAIGQALLQLAGLATAVANALPAQFPTFNLGMGGAASLPEMWGLLTDHHQQQLEALPGQLETQINQWADQLPIPPDLMQQAVEAATWKIGVLMADAKDAREERVKQLVVFLQAEAPLARTAAALALPWYAVATTLPLLQHAAQHDPTPTVRQAAQWAARALLKVLAARSPND